MTPQVSLSLELICLLSWLVKHDKSTLHKLVKHAVENGFAEELERMENVDHGKIADQMYSTVFDFLDFLEESLADNLEDVQMDSLENEGVIPMLQRLEADNIDFKTLWLSMQQTKNAINAHRADHGSPAIEQTIVKKESPSDILGRQLLKNWKPDNTDIVN